MPTTGFRPGSRSNRRKKRDLTSSGSAQPGRVGNGTVTNPSDGDLVYRSAKTLEIMLFGAIDGPRVADAGTSANYPKQGDLTLQSLIPKERWVLPKPSETIAEAARIGNQVAPLLFSLPSHT